MLVNFGGFISEGDVFLTLPYFLLHYKETLK